MQNFKLASLDADMILKNLPLLYRRLSYSFFSSHFLSFTPHP